MRSPRARAGRSRRAEPEPDAARSMEVATTALGMNGLGRQARPISSTSAITSSTEPPLPPSTGGIRSPGQPRVAIAFQRSWAKPAGSRASAWTRSGGQCCWRKARAVWLRSWEALDRMGAQERAHLLGECLLLGGEAELHASNRVLAWQRYEGVAPERVVHDL